MTSFIENGSSIVETLEARFMEEFLGYEDITKKNILLVEGKDDINVIQKIYIFANKEMPFDLRIPTSDSENDIHGDGKKHVFEYFDLSTDNIICLIDRDYDFILESNKEDTRIFYYHFFELENYIFSDDVFKKFIISRFGNKTLTELNIIYTTLKKYTNHSAYMNLYRFRLYSQLHFFNMTEQKLDAEKFDLYCKVVNSTSLALNIIDGHFNLKVYPVKDRLDIHLAKELNKIDSQIYNHVLLELERFEYKHPVNLLEFLQYYFNGKHINQCLIGIIALLTGATPQMKSPLNTDLYNEWIPTSSLLNNLMNDIEKRFLELYS